MIKKANIIGGLLSLFLFVQCTPFTQHDSAMDKTQHDYKKLTQQLDPLSVEPEIPPVIEDQEPEIPEELLKEVSLNITKDVSIPKIFQKIAEQTDINVLIAKNVAGSLIYKTKGQPLYQAINNLCEILNLRYTFENGLLKVEKDMPYLETYDIQFLSVSRKSQMNVSTNTQLFSKEQTKGINSSNGSSTRLDTLGANDFWEEIKLNLESILDSSNNVYTEPVQVIEEQASPEPTENKKKRVRKKTYFTVNKQSGLISVFANSKHHKEVDKFINRLRRNTNSQILIEAKVVEVNLKEEFKSGIDWSSITKGDFSANARLGSIAKVAPTIISNPATSSVATIGIDGKDFSSILNLMESFGTTRTLSSPRLTVMNNQTALLKVAENHVFFTVEYDRHYLNSTTNNNSSNNNGLVVASRSTIQSIPIGFVMAVQPAIDQDKDEIVINLRPTISRVIGSKADPSIAIINNSLNPGTEKISSEVPVVAVREIDSVMKLKSGQVAILGGLMVEGSENVDAGVPGTKGHFFSFLTRAKRDAQSVTELVIFIKASIVKNHVIPAADQRLYKQFTRDPRPL